MRATFFVAFLAVFMTGRAQADILIPLYAEPSHMRGCAWRDYPARRLDEGKVSQARQWYSSSRFIGSTDAFAKHSSIPEMRPLQLRLLNCPPTVVRRVVRVCRSRSLHSGLFASALLPSNCQQLRGALLRAVASVRDH